MGGAIFNRSGSLRGLSPRRRTASETNEHKRGVEPFLREIPVSWKMGLVLPF